MNRNVELSHGKMVWLTDEMSRGVITSMRRVDGDISCNVIRVDNNEMFCDCRLGDDFEPVADDIFYPGDRVKSNLGGGFTGVVLGYEYDTNRVICRSDKTDTLNGKDRCRYAYNIKDLVEIKKEYVFELNGRYRINGTTWVRIVERGCPETKYIMFNTATGEHMGNLNKLNRSYEELASHGFRSIEYHGEVTIIE